MHLDSFITQLSFKHKNSKHLGMESGHQVAPILYKNWQPSAGFMRLISKKAAQNSKNA